MQPTLPLLPRQPPNWRRALGSPFQLVLLGSRAHNEWWGPVSSRFWASVRGPENVPHGILRLKHREGSGRRRFARGGRGALRRVGRGLTRSPDSIERASQGSRRVAQGWRYHLPKLQTRAVRKREDTLLLADRCSSSALGPSFPMEGAAASLCLSEREGETHCV